MNKTIKINKDLFGAAPKNRNESKKHTQRNSGKASELKRQLLRRIKEHKQAKGREVKEKEKSASAKKSTDADSKTISTADEFTESMNYMSDLMSSRKDKISKEKSPAVQISLPPELREATQTTAQKASSPTVHIEIPAHGAAIVNGTQTSSKSQTRANPKFGCLRNGRLPTYRTWKKTQGASAPAPPVSLVEPAMTEPPSYRQKRLEQIKEKIKETAKPRADEEASPALPKKPKNKTLKNRVSLGLTGKEIRVLIKNQHTRKNDQEQKKLLQKIKIPDMKKELKDNGFIKSSSVAPPDVIRELFTARRLAGEIENKNQSAVLEGFLSPN